MTPHDELTAALAEARADPHGGKVMLSLETAAALAAGPTAAMAALIGRLAALPTRAEFVGDAGPRKPGQHLDVAIRESRRILAALAAGADVADVEGVEACGICTIAFRDGDECLTDVDLGAVHAACCGPERESYVDLDTGEPIAPDAPLPTPWIWTPAAPEAPQP